VNRALKLLFSLLITCVFGWWAFRDTNWNEQWESLRSANYLWLIPYIVLCLVVHVFRTLRWGFLLSGMEKVPFRKLNEAAGIGFMMLLVLPFRLGEFARPFLINQRSSIRRSAAMTSVVLERIVDGLFIAVLLRILLFFVSERSEPVRFARWGANVMFAIFGGGLAFLLFALWHQRRAVELIRRIFGRVLPGAASKIAEIVDGFVGAMRHLPSGSRLLGFFLFTAAYWAVNGWGMSIAAHAFDCGPTSGPGCVPLHLTLFQFYVVLCVLVVGIMIPSAPGMIGTFQAAVKLGLSLFLPAALVNGKGVAYANVIWFSQTGQQIGLGIILMSIGHLSFKDLATKLSKNGGTVKAGSEVGG
jgi:uncharacterized protein (TIRG00374 family)